MPRLLTDLYNEYKIATSDRCYSDGKWVPIKLDDYDVVIKRLGSGYATVTYKIIKNAVNLSYNELAMICDHGTPPFGYRVEGNNIVIYTD